MKNYEKPSVDFQSIVSFEKLSNLSDWLELQGEEFTDAGITTYLIES